MNYSNYKQKNKFNSKSIQKLFEFNKYSAQITVNKPAN